MKTRPIILCGGSGTRLWPESRENFPKQFIPIKNNGISAIASIRAGNVKIYLNLPLKPLNLSI